MKKAHRSAGGKEGEILRAQVYASQQVTMMPPFSIDKDWEMRGSVYFPLLRG